jgi:diguanylate cyclase (GGDEF)-like protein
MESGAWTGLWLGLAGAVLGVVGGVTGSAVAALAAGACALAAGGVSLRHQAARRDADERAAALTEQAADLERAKSAAERALLAKVEAEEAAPPPPPPPPPEPQAPEPAASPAPSGIESVTDPVTGMFNEVFFRVTLDQRVLAARRHLRPIALVLLDVVRTTGETGWVGADPVMVATALRTTLREADTACRLADGRFAILLEDTPEDGAVWTVERLRRVVLPGRPELVVWAGIACYPAHAFDAMEVLERADEALAAAREWRRDRIEVAPSPD